jgi:hypothetical protein
MPTQSGEDVVPGAAGSIKFDPVAVTLALIPVALQAAVLGTLMVLTYENTVATFIAAIAGSVWLKPTSHETPLQFGELRAKRQMFAALGEWMGRTDAGERFDRILSECLLIDAGLEHRENAAVATAAGIASGFQRFLTVLLQCYLALAVLAELRT